METKFLNNAIDISNDFQQLENEYFIPSSCTTFDEGQGNGKISWQLHRYVMDWFFNKLDKHLQLQTEKGAPFQDYDLHPECDFSLSFITQRTFRLRMKTTTTRQVEQDSLMLQGPVPEDKSWNTEVEEEAVKFKSNHATVVLDKEDFSLQLFDVDEKLLTRTQSVKELKAMHSKAMPFCFMKRAEDYSRSMAASFSLLPGERIYGGGESFTSLDKRGQKLVLFTTDAQSSASEQMYKPVPFFMSNRGYGMFIHTSSPVTLDVGHTHQGSQTLYVGEDYLDLFFFVGSPAEILYEYTALTGRSPLPPLWSFGLWMSRFSYQSEKQVEEVAKRLRKNKFPCDVIHIDAGWFEKGINCDFEFNKTTFPNPEKMFDQLRRNGFHASLWQIPYFTPHNPLFQEVVEKRLYITDGNGNVPTEDAILDLSNPEAIQWYQEKLRILLQKGASAIKVDFGEAAPFKGYYASGRTGLQEHNLYPLRYNQLVAELTQMEKNESIIWARSAWAGSQRYPVHWGGDAEVSDAGMAGTLRGGLSLGLSGFSFWSHDIGGFSGTPGEELFKRWSFFGLLSSHSRVHGFPPREPWEFSAEFGSVFRAVTELRYRLMPYIYAQAANCTQQGLPMLRALFINYPDDPAAWIPEDQYLLGNDVLVAPLMETGTSKRNVYLPEGKWIDYQTHKIYEGKCWQPMSAGELPGIILIKSGSIIPYIQLEQSTAFMDWSEIELLIFGDEDTDVAEGLFYRDGMKNAAPLRACQNKGTWELEEKPDGIEFYVSHFKVMKIQKSK